MTVLQRSLHMQHKSLQWLQKHFSSDETRSGWKIEYALLLFHREYYWNTAGFLRLCASNVKPYDILEDQMSTL